MKKILPILILLISLPILSAAQGSEKTLVRSFSTGECGDLEVNLDFPVSHQVWDRETIRVLLTVRLGNGSEAVLKSLVVAGRYRLELAPGEKGCLLVAPELGRSILLGNVPLEETLSIAIFAPETVTVSIKPREVGAAVNTSSKPTL